VEQRLLLFHMHTWTEVMYLKIKKERCTTFSSIPLSKKIDTVDYAFKLALVRR